MQKTLTSDQLSSFYHDEFVEDQVRDFSTFFSEEIEPIKGSVLDIGGGAGFFARAIQDKLAKNIAVVDMDPVSVEQCRKAGLQAEIGDAISMKPSGQESVVCFNLILHHLVAANEKKTRELQMRALSVWRGSGVRIFVNEYIYESYVNNFSGLLIYWITSSRLLSAIGKAVSKMIPAFRANTFGTGVRFRSHAEWGEVFKESGFRVAKVCIGRDETVALPLRILLIRKIRRDSFLLEA